MGTNAPPKWQVSVPSMRGCTPNLPGPTGATESSVLKATKVQSRKELQLLPRLITNEGFGPNDHGAFQHFLHENRHGNGRKSIARRGHALGHLVAATNDKIQQKGLEFPNPTASACKSLAPLDEADQGAGGMEKG